MRNYAFISYSHVDKKKVRKLHKKIEGFKIPGYVRKQLKDSPKRIYPIFRDETDLTGVELTQMIKNAISDSDFLIVICSENSVESGWVELEIEEFAREHNIEAIIPVFLEEKTRKEFQAAFPEGLQKLGKNINDTLLFNYFNSKICVFEIVTKILQCFSGNLTERYRRQQQGLQIIKLCMIFFLLMFILLDINWWYKERHDITKYYKDITYNKGWPEGVEQLHKYELSGEDDYYICTYRSNRIVKTEHVYQTADREVFPGSYLLETDCMEYSYNNFWKESGYATARISQVVCKNKDGETLFVKNYSLTQDVADLTVSEESCMSCYLPEDMTVGEFSTDMQEESGEAVRGSRIGQMYDERGWLKRVWFLSDTASYMICDENGYYGMEYVYNDTGEVLSVLYLDAHGEVMAEYSVDIP